MCLWVLLLRARWWPWGLCGCSFHCYSLTKKGRIWPALREASTPHMLRALYAAISLRFGKFLISDPGVSLFGILPPSKTGRCDAFYPVSDLSNAEFSRKRGRSEKAGYLKPSPVYCSFGQNKSPISPVPKQMSRMPNQSFKPRPCNSHTLSLLHRPIRLFIAIDRQE